MSFKGDRCEKFFTKGSGGKFLAKNNLKYHKYRAGKGMADDKVGEVKWEGTSLLNVNKGSIVFPKVGDQSGLAPVQQELWKITIKNLSKESNPPIVRFTGNIPAELFENLLDDPKTAPHIIVDTQYVHPKLDDMCLHIVKVHNDRLIAKHQPEQPDLSRGNNSHPRLK